MSGLRRSVRSKPAASSSTPGKSAKSKPVATKSTPGKKTATKSAPRDITPAIACVWCMEEVMKNAHHKCVRSTATQKQCDTCKEEREKCVQFPPEYHADALHVIQTRDNCLTATGTLKASDQKYVKDLARSFIRKYKAEEQEKKAAASKKGAMAQSQRGTAAKGVAGKGKRTTGKNPHAVISVDESEQEGEEEGEEDADGDEVDHEDNGEDGEEEEEEAEEEAEEEGEGKEEEEEEEEEPVQTAASLRPKTTRRGSASQTKTTKPAHARNSSAHSASVRPATPVRDGPTRQEYESLCQELKDVRDLVNPILQELEESKKREEATMVRFNQLLAIVKDLRELLEVIMEDGEQSKKLTQQIVTTTVRYLSDKREEAANALENPPMLSADVFAFDQSRAQSPLSGKKRSRTDFEDGQDLLANAANNENQLPASKKPCPEDHNSSLFVEKDEGNLISTPDTASKNAASALQMLKETDVAAKPQAN